MPVDDRLVVGPEELRGAERERGQTRAREEAQEFAPRQGLRQGGIERKTVRKGHGV
jgi:hypothetical protein